MAIAVTLLGSAATSGQVVNSTVITLTEDVPAGSLIWINAAFGGSNYPGISFADDAGNDYGIGAQNPYVENCLALTTGQHITINHPKGGTTQPGEGMVLVVYVYMVTGDQVVRDGSNSTSTSFDGPGWDGTVDVSIGIGSQAYERAIIATASGVRLIVSAGPSGMPAPTSAEPGWTSHGGLAAEFLSVAPLHTGLSNYGVLEASQIVPAGVAANWSASFFYDTYSFQAELVWQSFKETIPPGDNDISQVRTPGAGLLVIAHTNTVGTLKVDRYDTAKPPTLAASVTLESASGTGVSLVAHRMGAQILHDLLYAHLGLIKHRTSRDGGRNWSVATTIASSYQDVVHDINPSTGLAVAALWKESENRWYLAIGKRTSGTGDHVYTVVGTLVSNARRGASLIRTASRRYEFAYRTTSDVLTIIRCKALTTGAVGTWS